MSSLSQFVSDPPSISKFCIIYIISYYIVSIFSINATKPHSCVKRLFDKNGFVDYATSVTWLGFAILLIWSLIALIFSAELTLTYLILYYFFFIFLFAFWYGILDWHRPGMLANVSRDSWRALLEHLLISVQTQTTIGYTKGKPERLPVEIIACIQALLGIFFLAIAVAKAVNKLK